MKTWSLERAVVGFLSGAAVFVQGVIDAVSPPNFQPVGDAHPIPGCPDAVECRTHGCAGNCSEASECGSELVAEICRTHQSEMCSVCDEDNDDLWVHPRDLAAELARREAQEERGESRLNDGLTPFDPQWKMTVADGSPPCTCPCINCCNGAHWMCHGVGVEIDTVHDDAVSCPCGGMCPPACDRDALACVQIWGSADEHAEALRRNKTSQAVSADSSRDSAAEGGSAPVSPSVACKDPSPNGDEGVASVSDIPPSPEATRKTSELLDAAADFLSIPASRSEFGKQARVYIRETLLPELRDRAEVFRGVEDE